MTVSYECNLNITNQVLIRISPFPFPLYFCTLCSSVVPLNTGGAWGDLLPLDHLEIPLSSKAPLCHPHRMPSLESLSSPYYFCTITAHDTLQCVHLQACLSHSTRSFLRSGAMCPPTLAHGWPSPDMCWTEKKAKKTVPITVCWAELHSTEVCKYLSPSVSLHKSRRASLLWQSV